MLTGHLRSCPPRAPPPPAASSPPSFARSSLFLAKYGSLVGLLAVLYRAWSSTDPAQSLESSLSAAVHSVGTVGSLAGSALIGLSMLVGGETGDNVRKLASWLGPTNDKKKKKAAMEEEGDAAPPAYGTRSRRRTKAASPAAPGSNPLADLWNSATGASNGRPAGLAADGGGGGEGGGGVVADFLSKLLGAGAGGGGGGGGGETVEQLKEALGGGRAMADVLGALAGAVGGGGGGGAGAAAGGRR